MASPFSLEAGVALFPAVAYEDHRGALRSWQVRVVLCGPAGAAPAEAWMLARPAPPLPGLWAEIRVESGVVGGKVRAVVPTLVRGGKNLGRKNQTNALSQAISEANGLYQKQLKLAGAPADASPFGGVAPQQGAGAGAGRGKSPAAGRGKSPARSRAASASSAASRRGKSPGAAAGMPPPMLVKRLGETREATLGPADFAAGVTVQRKLNGVHLVVFRAKPGEVVCYSRKGVPLAGLEALRAELAAMFAAAPPGGPPDAPPPLRAAYGAPYLSGELYLHGRPLNWISGQARSSKDEGLLEFHVFDAFFPRAKALGADLPGGARQAFVDAFFAAAGGAPHPHVRRVENFPARDLAEVEALARRFLAEGYEGAIARKDAAGYEYSVGNYHSAGLLKIKPKLDSEFPVVGFTEGRRGKDVGALIWVCRAPGGTFSVVPRDMSYEERRRLFACLSARAPDGEARTRFERDILGLPLTVEYAELSAKTGIPLQAKAVAFRTYEGGPERDPIRRLLAECVPPAP